MQLSTEARWFFPSLETIPAIVEWFAGFGKKLNQDQFDRADYYLHLPGVTNLGFKIREAVKGKSGNWTGKLEAKILTKNLEIVQFENETIGQPNQWAKFSFSLPDGEPTLSEILDGFMGAREGAEAHWLKMEKSRIQLFYDPHAKKVQTSAPASKEGCGIELTIIRIQEQKDYSFALESFSATRKHEENFFAALDYFFSEVKDAGLSNTNCRAYPEFISQKLSYNFQK